MVACIVHLTRNTFPYAARRYWDELSRDPRPIYTAPFELAAKERFMEFPGKWGKQYRTAFGATAVQLAEYVHGRQRIVEQVGSARTEAELGVLLERARELLEDLAQGVFDLGVEPTPQVKRMVRPAHGPELFETVGSAGPADRAGPERVMGTDSRILFDALAGVFTGLGFDGLGDAVFRDLVVARVVEPTSLLDAGSVLRDLGRAPASYATMKRTLGRAAAGKYRDPVATWCSQHASTDGDVSLVLYDVTTLYFEAEKEDELRKVGYSNERRVDPQIIVGLLVDRGFPLEIGCFEGNKAETANIVPIIKEFQSRHGLTDMVVVADLEAHLTIVFTALAVSRTVQSRTRLAVPNVIKQLRPLQSATIAINGTTQTFAPAITAEQQAILDALLSPKITH